MSQLGLESRRRGLPSRFSAAALLLAICLCQLPAGAEDGPEAASSLDVTVNLVRSAAEAGDREWLQSHADGEDPDPWLVADRLCSLNAWAEALMFAESGTRPDSKGMHAYVSAVRALGRKESDDLQALRQSVAQGRAVLLLPDGNSVPALEMYGVKAEALVREGRVENAEQMLLRAAHNCQQLGWLAQSARFFRRAAELARGRRDAEQVQSALERLHEIQSVRESPAGIVEALLLFGETQHEAGDDEVALDYLLQARETARDANLLTSVATAWRTESRILSASDLARAHDALDKAMAIANALEDHLLLALTTNDLALLQALGGDRDEAIETFGLVLAMRQEMEDDIGVAVVHRELAMQYKALGKFKDAYDQWSKAREILATTRDVETLAGVIVDIGELRKTQGRHADALKLYDAALELYDELHLGSMQARVKARIAEVYIAMGDLDSAHDAYDDAQGRFEKNGDKDGMAITLNEMSELCELVDDGEGGFKCADQAAAAARLSGRKDEEASAILNGGTARLKSGELEDAEARIKKALEMFGEIGHDEGRAKALVSLGNVQVRKRELEAAMRSFTAGIDLSKKLGLAATELQGREALAHAQLLSKNPQAAVVTIRDAVPVLPRVLRGFSDLQGTKARAKYAPMLALGLGAALDIDDARAACYFLESGRAGAFLEMLGNTAEIQEALIPAEVRERLGAAREEVRQGQAAMAEARATGRRKLIRYVRKHLRASQDEEEAAIRRLHVEQKLLADIIYPEADELEVIQERLNPGEAMVLYGRALRVSAKTGKLQDTYVALVLWPYHTRLVELGPVGPIESLLALARPKDSKTPMDESDLVRVRARLVDPLELGAAVTRVLVSPEGPIPFIPMALLFPERQACLVPSGTTVGVLRRDQGEPGAGVLALADPDYSIGRPDLPSLIESRRAAEQLGSELLLGREATIAALNMLLRAHVGRWRGVHLACHGTVNEEDPLRSALIVTADEEIGDDGTLEAIDVYAMQIRSDIVSLSACETGLGEMARGEGVLGLVRGFMLAGSPRVLSSLWKVDDAATRALMVKFYEYWNPGDGSKALGAAAALKKAQAFVKGHDKWQHPWYWAGWALWGLGD